MVFHAAGCAACHGEDLSGGLEMVTERGIFRAPNITPDPETGIGGWSTVDFVNAMQRGLSPRGNHYYPAFPYTSYTRMRVEDVIDLKAYIDSVSPVESQVAGHDLRFPFNIRRGVGLWKRRYLDAAPVVETDSQGEQFERGRYLVEALGHCAECHTSRDRFGAVDPSGWMAGAPNPNGEGSVPNITPHADGLGRWSQRDISYYLESGFTPDFDSVGGSMVEVQENMARLTAADRDAIATYLKSIPALPSARD
jgi:mono/diheme cytochrome c family protein